MTDLPLYRQTRVVRTQFRPGQRILMISDIHGHDSVFRRLLKKAAFTKDDALVIVGDLLEKGPFSLDTLFSVHSLSLFRRSTTVALALAEICDGASCGRRGSSVPPFNSSFFFPFS